MIDTYPEYEEGNTFIVNIFIACSSLRTHIDYHLGM